MVVLIIEQISIQREFYTFDYKWGVRFLAPPMWPGFKSRRRRHMWVEFVVGSLLCSERVFFRVLRFSPLLKNQHFQIPIRPGIRQTKNHFVEMLPLNHYSFIIYLCYCQSQKKKTKQKQKKQTNKQRKHWLPE